MLNRSYLYTVLRLLSEVPSCWKTPQDTGGQQLKDLHCCSKKGADGVAHYDITVEWIPYRELFPWGSNFCYFCSSPRCHEIFYPQNFPPMKFSTHCVVLPTRGQVWISNILLCLFFATCATLRVSSILRAPFLKLSCVWWVKKWADKYTKQKHDQQKTGPVSLVKHGRA